jgi:Rrf2 family protein
MAVHVMALLARNHGEQLKSAYLSKSVNTNPVVIRRLLCSLNQAGLVVSQTGACGGTKLTRRPGEIALIDIYRAVSPGEVFALHGKTPNKDCPVGKNIGAVLCALQGEIEEAIEARLSRRTLKDVIAQV